MASNITETDTWEANVVGPDDGDAVNALSVRNGLQDLANRTTHIRKGIPGLGASTYAWDVALNSPYNSNQYWKWQLAAQAWVQNDVAAARPLVVPAAVPAYGKIVGYRVRLHGAMLASHGGLPATMPNIKLYYGDGTSLTLIGSGVNDPSGSLGAYEVSHDVTETGLSHTIGADYRYYFYLSGETGAGSVADTLGLIKATLQIEAT